MRLPERALAVLLLAAGTGAQADPADLKPFRATYLIDWKGMTAGTSTLELKRSGTDQYSYSSVNVARGVFRMAFEAARVGDERRRDTLLDHAVGNLNVLMSLTAQQAVQEEMAKKKALPTDAVNAIEKQHQDACLKARDIVVEMMRRHLGDPVLAVDRNAIIYAIEEIVAASLAKARSFNARGEL